MSEQTTLVRVTPAHIERGVVQDCERCPVALAVINALGDLFTEGSVVDVDIYSIVFWPAPGGDACIAMTPDVAADFISAYDDLGDVGPFEFTLTWSIKRFEATVVTS
jgi:hypothetical protein